MRRGDQAIGRGRVRPASRAAPRRSRSRRSRMLGPPAVAHRLPMPPSARTSSGGARRAASAACATTRCRRPDSASACPTSCRRRTSDSSTIAASGLAGAAPLTWIVCGRDLERERAGRRQEGGQLREPAERRADRGCAAGVERHRAQRRLAGAREFREPLAAWRRRAGVRTSAIASHVRSGSISPLPDRRPRRPPSGSRRGRQAPRCSPAAVASSRRPVPVRTIFTCGRNGSVGCSCVTTPISSVFRRTSVPTG